MTVAVIDSVSVTSADHFHDDRSVPVDTQIGAILRHSYFDSIDGVLRYIESAASAAIDRGERFPSVTVVVFDPDDTLVAEGIPSSYSGMLDVAVIAGLDFDELPKVNGVRALARAALAVAVIHVVRTVSEDGLRDVVIIVEDVTVGLLVRAACITADVVGRSRLGAFESTYPASMSEPLAPWKGKPFGRSPGAGA